ncbi:hypothetical protein PMAN_a0844 [Pseudoalteromonas marina]|nr:hypothetical protein PMAN_a0844 [Pseudoalteromonas marina]
MLSSHCYLIGRALAFACVSSPVANKACVKVSLLYTNKAFS